MYEKTNSITNYINALDSSQIPRMFVKEGLRKISLFPIGYATGSPFYPKMKLMNIRNYYTKKEFPLGTLGQQFYFRMEWAGEYYGYWESLI